jgi:hypothetical protein
VTIVNAAAPIDNPHTLVFFIATMACLVLTLLPQGNKRGISWQRKVYWGGTFSAAICAFIASLPNVATGLILALLAVFLMTLSAYFTSQYIRIGKRVIAFHSASDLRTTTGESGDGLHGEDPYGSTVSAAKMWWLLAVCTVIATINLYGYLFDGDEVQYGILGLGLLIGIGALIGCGDGIRRQRVARGQYVPFGIVALVSAGIVTVSYLAAYSIATRFQKSPK